MSSPKGWRMEQGGQKRVEHIRAAERDWRAESTGTTGNGNANKNGLCAACAVVESKWEIQIQLVLNNSVSHYANELFYSGDALCCWYEAKHYALAQAFASFFFSFCRTNRIPKMCDRKALSISNRNRNGKGKTNRNQTKPSRAKQNNQDTSQANPIQSNPIQHNS